MELNFKLIFSCNLNPHVCSSIIHLSVFADLESYLQVLLVCNAILNTAYHEKSRVSADAPLGIASTVTPMLTRTSSKGMRQVVTAKSIKHHKWLHVNEEVSGDYTESLMQDSEYFFWSFRFQSLIFGSCLCWFALFVSSSSFGHEKTTVALYCRRTRTR